VRGGFAAHGVDISFLESEGEDSSSDLAYLDIYLSSLVTSRSELYECNDFQRSFPTFVTPQNKNNIYRDRKPQVHELPMPTRAIEALLTERKVMHDHEDEQTQKNAGKDVLQASQEMILEHLGARYISGISAPSDGSVAWGRTTSRM